MNVALVSVVVAGCGGGGGGSSSPVANCTETGVSASYACQSGSTEPLYTYQWALKLASSFFSVFSTTTGGMDLNVESVHQSGLKGQGVRVLVLDDGLETTHEDLAGNVDSAMSYNFGNASSDPSPTGTQQTHGTSVAGIIAAAQNGRGVMGLAPRAILGGANYLTISPTTQQVLDAYGGTSWSATADIINASYGTNPSTPPQYPDASVPANLSAIRAFPNLRSGKGLVYVKASGNEFYSYDNGVTTRDCPSNVQGVIGCEVPAHDTETLETNVITVAAANANALRASYSNVGAVNWVTGLAGEFANGGTHGQTGGPILFTTDQKGCAKGYSYTGTISGAYAANAFLQAATYRNGSLENSSCDYGMLNGTSAATPTVAGVVALMLQANPNLTWRDVREILRSSARKIQSSFGSGPNNGNRAKLIDLTSSGSNGGAFTSTAVGTSADLQDNATTARVEYGWQTNGAGYEYSNAFGFGLVDAATAVAQAKATTTYRSATLAPPAFSSVTSLTSLSYGRVTRLPTVTVAGTGQVDAFQVRMSGPLCVGSVGVFVRSPAGTVSALSVPYNIYYNTGKGALTDYALSSYAFFGESKAGNWEVFLVSGTPAPSGGGTCTAAPSGGSPLTVQYRILGRA